jgi:hypothetical protein
MKPFYLPLALAAALLSVQTTFGQETTIYLSGVASGTTQSVIGGVGSQGGYSNYGGAYNTVLGYRSGSDLMRSNNILIGNNIGQSLNGGSNNVAIGSTAGFTLRSGANNVMIGDSAGYKVYGAQGSVFIGAKAGFNTSSMNYNTFVGYRAGYRNVADGNTYIGYEAGAEGTSDYSSSNTFVGSGAGKFNTGRANTFIGSTAGAANTGGTFNVFIGALTGQANTTGYENSFIGTLNGQNNTTGNSNTFIGYAAGRSNTSGQFNTFVGVQAGISNTIGNSNFIMGTNAGSRNTTGSANFFLGDNAGGSNSTGGFNVFLGANAGASNTVGDNNTAIGFEANVGSGNLVNATAIGFRAVASANNSLVLGNGANVGIGTSSPTSKLHLVTGTANQSGLRLENLTSNSPASATGQTKFLTVDGSGNVILGSTTSGGRVGADLWHRSGNTVQSIDESAVIIGQGISKTPTDYNLFVSKGILTEKVKVAVKNASEWSDYVFAPAYKLAPLAEVEQHIKEKGHLPGVPSAAEVVEQGVDMAKMDAKLLEKIEELTLYSIQQQTTIEKQQAELNDIKKLVRQLLERK